MLTKTIINLKNNRDKRVLTGDEKEKLKKAVSEAMSEIKKGIGIFASTGKSVDVKDVFEHFEVINSEIGRGDKREIVELVCQKGNVKLLEMICRQENRDERDKTQVNQQYSWKGEFTGYERLTDLLQYVLNQECSSEIVLCIAKKVHGNAHIIYNGEQYLDSKQVANIKVNFDYQSSVIKDCLKAAIELGYKDVVSVMLSGDIYQCIRLTKGEKFQEEKKALDMIKEVVAEVMSSWVNCKQDLSKEVKDLLEDGIEVDINKMEKKDLIDELECRGKEVKGKKNITKKELVEMLKEEGGGKVRIRLSKTVVGGLISTLFFNYQDKLMEKPFELGISRPDASKREKEINELKEKIDSRSFVEEKVLEVIKSLTKSSHIFNNWFFREVLAAIVNDEEKLDKLKAVCAAICKEPMQELLKGVEVHKDVVNVLESFGVEVLSSQITTNLTSFDSECIIIDEKEAETTKLREMEEIQNRVGKIEAQLIELKKAVKDLQEASTSQQQSAKAANNQQKESGSDTQFGQQQQPDAQATDNDQPSSKLSKVRQISRGQSPASLKF